jgi:hypothetical protein
MERKPTRKPRYRREREGRLTGRLVSEEAMNDALRYLLEDCQRYMLIVNRSIINPDSGESQDPSVILSDDNPPLLSESLDARLKRSRQVIIVLVQKDGGVAKIDLTARRWEVWIKSATLPRKIRVFNKKLASGARTRVLTAATGWWIITLPLWATFLLFLGWSLSTSQRRHEVWGSSHGSKTPWPGWIVHFETTMLSLWPLWVICAVVIWLVVIMGGGLRIWPRYLSSNSLQRAAFQVRSNFVLPQNLNAPLFVGVVCAVLSALITYLLTR